MTSDHEPGADSPPKDPGSAEALLQVLYDELRQLARARMAAEPPGHTLQATALVHEAYLRLANQDPAGWANRAHFFAAAAEAMRRILIDRARWRRAARHGGGQERVEWEEFALEAPGPDEELLFVHEAVEQLAAQDPGKAQLVKLRYFGGLTFEETALAMGLSVPTVKRHWIYARAWLFRELTGRREGIHSAAPARPREEAG
ncbi:MAG: sigma-70 family RNA polymerase sigma factor [Verrucomicrobiales bacterium]|nr:sigma-70 family RNA polymerase sigma factor [Verrucomicrobiales bacterium]